MEMGTKNLLLLLPVHRQEATEEGRKWEQGPPGRARPSGHSPLLQPQA